MYIFILNSSRKRSNSHHRTQPTKVNKDNDNKEQRKKLVPSQSAKKVIDNDKIRQKDKDNRDKDKENRVKDRDNETRSKEKEEEIEKDDPEVISKHIRLYNEYLKAKEIDIANDIKASLPKLKPFTSDQSTSYYNNNKNRRYQSNSNYYNNRSNDSYYHSQSRRFNDYNYYNSKKY